MRAAVAAIVAGAAVLLHAPLPCAAADKAPSFVDIRITEMRPGSVKIVRWQARPFWVVRSDAAMLDDLRAQTPHTWSLRAIPAKPPAFFVFSGLSPGADCALVHAGAGAPRYAPQRIWQGGFYDPCRFGEWDYAGRTIRQYPDQDEAMRRPDLEVPPFALKDRSTLRIGR